MIEITKLVRKRYQGDSSCVDALGNSYWKAKEVARALDYDDEKKMYKLVDSEDKRFWGDFKVGPRRPHLEIPKNWHPKTIFLNARLSKTSWKKSEINIPKSWLWTSTS